MVFENQTAVYEHAATVLCGLVKENNPIKGVDSKTVLKLGKSEQHFNLVLAMEQALYGMELFEAKGVTINTCYYDGSVFVKMFGQYENGCKFAYRVKLRHFLEMWREAVLVDTNAAKVKSAPAVPQPKANKIGFVDKSIVANLNTRMADLEYLESFAQGYPKIEPCKIYYYRLSAERPLLVYDVLPIGGYYVYFDGERRETRHETLPPVVPGYTYIDRAGNIWGCLAKGTGGRRLFVRHGDDERVLELDPFELVNELYRAKSEPPVGPEPLVCAYYEHAELFENHPLAEFSRQSHVEHAQMLVRTMENLVVQEIKKAAAHIYNVQQAEANPKYKWSKAVLDADKKYADGLRKFNAPCKRRLSIEKIKSFYGLAVGELAKVGVELPVEGEEQQTMFARWTELSAVSVAKEFVEYIFRCWKRI